MDIAVRPKSNIIDNEKGSVRILGDGSVHISAARRADIHIRSSMQETDLNAVGDGMGPDEVEVEEAESGSRVQVKLPEEAFALRGWLA